MGAQIPRPVFFEGQYLSADDLAAVVDYVRTADARHALGGHSWGISLGLDLVEADAPGAANRKEVILQPGLAWDGFGRVIAVDQPTRLSESLCQAIAFDPGLDDPADPVGRLVKVWLSYKEQGANPPAPGFENCDTQMARAQEGFELLVGDFAPAQQRGNVIIGPESIEATQALIHFNPVLTAAQTQGVFPTLDALADGSPFVLWNTSVPHQAFPLEGRPPRWLIPIGYVRWVAGQDTLGYFLDREHAATDRVFDRIRAFRRYAGVVAESIEAAAGAIVLRRRGERPDDSHRFARLLSKGADKVLNDLVWVEGNLRVLGDARLAGGRLIFLDADGSDQKTPLYLDRQGDSRKDGADGQRQLRTIIGNNDQTDNVFIVGPLQAGTDPRPVSPNLVVTSGRAVGAGGTVGVNVLTPERTVHVLGDRVRLDKEANTRIELRVDDGAAVALHSETTKLRIRSSGSSLGNNQVVINSKKGSDPDQGDGNVGIGIDNPQFDLDVKAKTIKLGLEDGGGGQLLLRSDASNQVIADVRNTAGTGHADELRITGGPDPSNLDDDLPLLSAYATKTYLKGKLGVGIAEPAPDTQVHVRGSRIRLENAAGTKSLDLRSDGGAVDVQSTTSFVYIRSTHTGGPPDRHIVMNAFPEDGNVGVGTEIPQAKLHVAGDAVVDGKLGVGISSPQQKLHVAGDTFVDGRLGVGISSPQQKLHVAGNYVLVDGAAGQQAYIGHDGATKHVHIGSLNPTVMQVCLLNGGTAWMDLKCRDITADGHLYPSDARLKSGIAGISGSLERVRQLRGVSFEWKKDQAEGKPPLRHLGLIAQEVAEILPEAVTAGSEGELAISMTSLFPVLIESIKELKAEVDDLRGQLAAQGKRKGVSPK